MKSLGLNVELEGAGKYVDVTAEFDEDAQDADLISTLQADAAKTAAEEEDALTSIAADLADLLGGDLIGGDGENELIGGGEEQ